MSNKYLEKIAAIKGWMDRGEFPVHPVGGLDVLKKHPGEFDRAGRRMDRISKVSEGRSLQLNHAMNKDAVGVRGPLKNIKAFATQAMNVAKYKRGL